MTFTKTILVLFFLFPALLHAFPSQEHETLALEETLTQQACVNTTDSTACIARIRTECQRRGLRGPLPVLHAAIRGTIDEARRAVESISDFAAISDNLREQTAINDCAELVDRTVDELSWSLLEMGRIESGGGVMHREANLWSWMSAALDNQDTCLEGFHGTDGRLKHYMFPIMKQVTQLVSNVLELCNLMHSILPHDSSAKEENGELPYWIGQEEVDMMNEDRRSMSYDAVVALDGTGRYRTVNEAVNAAPNHSGRRYVILVKRGVYKENVELKKKKANIMIVGEGMGQTVITGSRNFMQGWTTYRTATFAVSGPGFIARDITFRNTAGPQNHQAVALRIDSDRSAFFRCSMEGYQDTLYAHSLRQFFRECSIYGTVDFIFGNAAAVFQNCKMYTRKPLPYQKITVTAQGRKDPNQNTGFSIQNSYIYATSTQTFLGRPWKAYSRTVFMQTYLGEQVQPAGWLEWYGNFALSTLFYGEYKNYGPGAGLSNRVNWPGYHVLSENVASAFTVRRFIDGAAWLPATTVPFVPDLTN